MLASSEKGNAAPLISTPISGPLVGSLPSESWDTPLISSVQAAARLPAFACTAPPLVRTPVSGDAGDCAQPLAALLHNGWTGKVPVVVVRLARSVQAHWSGDVPVVGEGAVAGERGQGQSCCAAGQVQMAGRISA